MTLLGGHLRRLFDLSGRENRQPFWLWILIVYAAAMIVGMLVTFPLMAGFASRMAPLAQSDPHQFDVHPELMFQIMMPMMQQMMVFACVMAVVQQLLIVAAVVRRLHDGDRSGWWAAPVLLFQTATPIVYAIFLPRFFGVFGAISAAANSNPADFSDPAFRSINQVMSLLSLVNLVGFLFLLILIVLLALPGTTGPNRHGPDPLLEQ